MSAFKAFLPQVQIIEGNSITATEAGILFYNTQSSAIVGNMIQWVKGNACTKGVGIKLEGSLSFNSAAASTGNILLNNVLTQNSIGILLECGA